MLKPFFYALSLFGILLISGCASLDQMAFSDGSSKSLESGNPIYLMTTNLKNEYRTSFQPELRQVHLKRSEGGVILDRLTYSIDDIAKSETDDSVLGNSYYLRMELPEGNYTIDGLSSMGSTFPVNGFYYAPINQDLKAEGNKIYYLGHIEAKIRERVGDEFRAGPVIPILYQAISGAAGGTFDVNIIDNWEQDRRQFLNKFPMLEGQSITKAILPEFDREKAQEIWEAE